jgi:hypothetical protein
MACSSCQCSPCACRPAALANPQIFGGIIDGSTLNGAVLNNGISTGLDIRGATLDCTTTGCTLPTSTNNALLATTAFVHQFVAAELASIDLAQGGLTFATLASTGSSTGLSWTVGPVAIVSATGCPTSAPAMAINVRANPQGTNRLLMTFSAGVTDTPLTPCSGFPAENGSGFLFQHWNGVDNYSLLALRRDRLDLNVNGPLYLNSNPGLAGQSLRSQGPGLPPIWS